MTLDYGAMQQVRAALDMARDDMARVDKLTDTDGVFALAERYAAFLLCGEDVTYRPLCRIITLVAILISASSILMKESASAISSRASRVQTHKIHQTIAATRQTDARKFRASLS
jgi:hypothetical protein